MTKKLILLLALGLVATLTPALAEPGSEAVASQAEMAPAGITVASEAGATEAAESHASQVATPAMDAVSAVEIPIFSTVLDTPKTGITITCNLCDTHSDCTGVCPGQPIYDFVCSRHFNSCYGWGPKVCICT